MPVLILPGFRLHGLLVVVVVPALGAIRNIVALIVKVR
jgi:hypothetical protein